MRDKVVLGITLAIVLLVTLGIYGAVDTNRGPSTGAAFLESSVNNGKRIYASFCTSCHGPQGEGCIGPALNKAVFRKVIDGRPNPNYDEGTGHDLIKRTVVRGRAANQPGIQMPAWSVAEGGALNDEEIEDVTNFVLVGNWTEVLENIPSAANLSEDVPGYPGFQDKAKLAQVKQLMLSKGCLNCHTMGKAGGLVAAPLSEVGSRRTADWLKRWIKNPKSVPASERGPNLWLVGPTPSLETPGPRTTPAATAVAYVMNPSFMPTIPMTDDELNLLVDYLSHAKIAKK